MKLSIERVYAIDCALISTLALSQDYDICVPKMNPEDFYYPFHRKLVKALNSAIERGESLGLALMKIEEKISGTEYEQDYVMATGSTPLPSKAALDYYAELKRQRIIREVAA